MVDRRPGHMELIIYPRRLDWTKQEDMYTLYIILPFSRSFRRVGGLESDALAMTTNVFGLRRVGGLED